MAVDFTCLAVADCHRSAHLGVLPLGDKFYLIPPLRWGEETGEKNIDCTVSFMVQM